jgi:hypothetical protein
MARDARPAQSPAPVKQNREVAMDAMMKFSELARELATRTYDGMIGTFTANGVADGSPRCHPRMRFASELESDDSI